MRISRVYTRTGDQGLTRLVGNIEVPKNHPRIEAYGTVDELNSIIGMARAASGSRTELAELDGVLQTIQSELFDVGTDLATPLDARWEGMVRPGEAYVVRLETWCDKWNAELDPLKEFILPGGGQVASTLHLARTVCRRAERRVMDLLQIEPEAGAESLRYLNRLSDLLFVMARYSSKCAGETETFWQNPNRRKV